MSSTKTEVKYYKCESSSTSFYYKEHPCGKLEVNDVAGWIRAFYTSIPEAKSAGIIVSPVSRKHAILAGIDD